MNKGLKITLIVVGSLALVGGITYAISRSVRKKKEQKEEQEKELQETQQLEEINTGLDSQQSINDNRVVPIRNLDKVLNNSFSEIKGVKIYPSKKSNDPIQGHPYAEGYANIRTSPEVDNTNEWGGIWGDNLLGKVSAGSSIGTIVSEQYDNMTPKMRWFKVKLTKKIDGEQYGWVRGDNVTFFPFTKKSKKSSFDGDFVQKYDNSYQLGAEVFPHSDWMIGYPAYGNDVTSDFEGDLDLNL
jgi:hypothetical protein